MGILRGILKQKLIVATVTSVSLAIGIGLLVRHYSTSLWTKREVMYVKFPGELFMRLVNCLILPLVTCNIISATCNMSKSGSIGLLALVYYAATTTSGIVLSIILSQTVRPGELAMNKQMAVDKPTRYFMTIDTVLDLLRNLIPENIVNACLNQYQTVLTKPTNDSVPIEQWEISGEYMPGTNILGLVFLSLTMGLIIGNMNAEGIALQQFFESLSKATMKIMSLVILVTPISIFFLICGKVLEVPDFGSIMERLGKYVATVFGGLIIQGFIILPLMYFIATRKSPYKVILKLGPAFATAFGTSSSTATVPMTLKCLDKIGIDPKVSRFIVPIGATINMDGIALYETIGAIFVIQLRGIQFPLAKIIVISILCTISCIGAAGLPSGGYVMLIMVLNSVDVPVEDVSLIIAVDWFVDRFRTSINIIADALGAGIISNYYRTRHMDSPQDQELTGLNSLTT